MNEIMEKKKDTLNKIRHFLKKAEESTDPLDVYSNLLSISEIANKASMTFDKFWYEEQS